VREQFLESLSQTQFLPLKQRDQADGRARRLVERRLGNQECFLIGGYWGFTGHAT